MVNDKENVGELDYSNLKTQRTIIKGKITRISNWLRTIDTADLGELSEKYDYLKDTFRSYEYIQDSIDALTPTETLDSEDRGFIETSVHRIGGIIKDRIQKLCAPPPSTSATPVQQTVAPHIHKVDVKLPEINIKPFKGDISEWLPFYQIFDALIIQNGSLSKIQKFLYLKSFLRDEPLKLIENLIVIHDNFETALEILRKRYENKLSVINTHLVSLLEVPPVTKSTAPALRDFVTNCKRNLDSLRNLKYSDEQLLDFVLIYLLGKKIDFGTRKAFENERDVDELPQLSELFEFLEKRCLVLENLNSTGAQITPKFTKPHLKASLHAFAPQNNDHAKCCYCDENTHKIYSCNKFKNVSIADKRNFVNSKKLCYNCLGTAHAVAQCSSTNVCSFCSKKHHSMLHAHPTNRVEGGAQNVTHNNPHRFDKNRGNHQNGLNDSNNCPPPSRNGAIPRATQGNSGAPSHDSLSLSASTRDTQVLLATACVSLYDAQGHCIQAKAILDNGSQNSFVTDKLVKKLNYVPYNKTICVSGIALSNSMTNKMVDLTLYSNVYSNKTFKVSCAILTAITCRLPQAKINTDSWNIPSDMPLADVSFSTPSDVDLLLGADVYYKLLACGIVQLGKNLPILLNTYLGWVIGGPFSFNASQNRHTSHLSVSLLTYTEKETSEENILEKMVSRFWALEEISPNIPLSLEDEQAETLFLKTTKILENGVFQVDLPLKSPEENLKLGDSFPIARKRFYNLEKRFERDKRYFSEYKKFIEEYECLGHGRFVPLTLTNCHSQPKYFLPHHAVIKEDSITTKLRVVFDASCKSSSGFSLNDLTLKGYQVQPDLYDILCRFRSFKYVLTSDIQKMYRQILINPEQRFLLNILWRNSPQETLKCLELSTVTYGTNCAPFLATRVLQQIAQNNVTEYPLASEALLKMTYVDDCLGGVDEYSDLETLHAQLNTLLNIHGFQLHKWCSNSTSFLSRISQEKTFEQDLNFDDSPSKVLGLKWNPFVDYFCVSIPENSFTPPITKRKILSTLAQCYDPLGFLSLVIVSGKLIIQKLWTLKLDWDSPITDRSIVENWKQFIENLHVLKSLKIPRYIFLSKKIEQIELHGFADASMQAYASCAYFRVIYNDSTVSCRLISSKSRVAPLKTVSLPRLELCAMLLLSQLAMKLLSVFDGRFMVNSVNLWSDSQVALCWINSHASRWNVFVANRVAQIQNLTKGCVWRHVRSADNPADLPSRGVPIKDAINLDLWWIGPPFLLDPNLRLAEKSFENVPKIDELPEERKKTAIILHALFQDNFWSEMFLKFSQFSKLQRHISFILRFAYNIRNKDGKIGGPLEVDELRKAERLIVKVLQSLHFSKEIQELRKGEVRCNNQLARLKPFLDVDDIVRVGGRLEHANIPFDQKHPILLPSRNYIVSLMLKREHLRLGHSGAQTVLSNFKLRFWPLNGLREVKRLIRNCHTCFKFRAQPTTQLMGDLPKERVQETRCFNRVGVDYGGPFLLKSSNLRKAPIVKAYIGVFVCMVTKAVHLELVTSLSTEAFIMTLKRFIARRGNPEVIFSDNATNFVGAKNQLKELYDFFKTKQVSDSIKAFSAQNEIKFKFIPPRSPHWGGIWEAAVKSTKYHLHRLVGETRLTFEEFYTLLTSIEAILNSRPLCPLSNDPNDFQALTPGHFLIGTSLTAHPERNLENFPENRLSHWERVSQIQQIFWKRWRLDYLNRLQHRPKWFRESDNLKIGSIVLLREDDTPPLKWPLARILEVIPGKDKRVRLVKLKTQDGIYTRSIAKVCPLPQEESPEMNFKWESE